MAFENLLTYTEVDSAGDLTVDSTSVVFDTMRRDAISYVYKDHGAGYFGNFDIDFEFEITSGNTIGFKSFLSILRKSIFFLPFNNRSNFITLRPSLSDFSNIFLIPLIFSPQKNLPCQFPFSLIFHKSVQHAQQNNY